MYDRRASPPALPSTREKVHGAFQRVALAGLTRFTVFIGGVMVASGLLQWLLDIGRPITVKRIAFGLAFLAAAWLAGRIARWHSPRVATVFLLGGLLAAMGAYAWWTGRGLGSQMLAGGAVLIAMTGALLSFGAALAVAAIQAVQVLALYQMGAAGGPPVPVGDLLAHLLLILGAVVAGWVLSWLMSGALQAALTSRIEIEAVLDEAPVGIATVREGRFHIVNEQLRGMLGVPADALQGRPFAELFEHRLRRDEPAADLLARLDAERGIEYECTIPPIDADSAPIDVHVRARRLPSARERAGNSVWVVEDVTARRRQQAELANAKAAAEDANRAKSAFLANMSHEIRTPLNGVLGLARLLQDGALPPERRQVYVDHLVTAADQLSGLLDDVLDMSKIEAGEMTIEDIPYAVREVVQQACASFRWRAEEKGLRLLEAVDPRVPQRVRGDPVRVRQIVVNYLSNAVKFTAAGDIRVDVSVPAPGRLRIAVTDTGPGIPDAVADKLFQPFTQADRSIARRYGGSGLGLAICRSLAERMQGGVGMTTHAGGSTFWFELPVEPVGREEPAPSPPRPESLLAGAVVLVVDDNAVNRLVATAMLERHGARVVEARDGFDAVEQVRRQRGRFDLVLMDLYMPGCDGFEATRAIQALVEPARLPIVALSASVLKSEREAAVAAGLSAFLPKPLVEGELVRVASGLLAERPATA